MGDSKLELSTAVHEAFAGFLANSSILALPLVLTEGSLQALPPVDSKDSSSSFQTTLNELSTVLKPRTPMYLLLRRNDSIVAITFAPYLAKDTQRAFFVDNRHEIVQQLGREHFSQSLICKEIGEITDARSWIERDNNSSADPSACKDSNCESCAVEDLGYKRNKCRLCDRRMQNPIAPDALSALATLSHTGAIVQITINPSTLLLSLSLAQHPVQPLEVQALLPPSSPSFTFYHHPTSHLLYFISHAPDSASVQARMKHTMAIPGLLVHAEDAGVKVDEKIEIHEPGDLDLVEKEKDRKYRSMWRREGYQGTELGYAEMERDKEFWDSV